MSSLRFPRNDKSVKPTYYSAYYTFVMTWAKYASIEVVMEDKSDDVWCGGGVNAFGCVLDDQPMVMDFSDFNKLQAPEFVGKTPYFKWHYYEKHKELEGVYPLTPLLHFDWAKFVKTRSETIYAAIPGGAILNNQRPRARALERRTLVQKMLKRAFPSRVDFSFSLGEDPQQDWWKKHGKCLVSIAIPGAREDILDRGQLEEMGLGTCVISTPITTILGGNQEMVPWEHYIPIELDFSDLIEKVKWCDKNRKKCLKIGQNAKSLFDSICPPDKYWKWVRECLARSLASASH